MPKKRRLLWQLYPSYLLITIISLVAVTWYASESLRHFFLEQTASDLKVRAHFFEKQVLEYLDPLDEKAVDLLCKKIGKHAATRITVILPSGKVVGDSEKNPARMDNHVDRPEFIKALTGPSGTSTRYSRTLEKDMMYVGIPIKKKNHILAVIRTSVPVNDIDLVLKSIKTKIAFGVLIVALFAAMLSLFVSRRITRPIEQIKSWADSIARGEFQLRPPVAESEEIGALSDALNRMAVELREHIDIVMRQRNEIEAVLSSMVEGVIAVDMEERIISMNHAAAKMFGCDPAEAQGRSIQEVVRNTVLQQFVKNALSSQKAVEKEIVLSSESDRFLNGHGTLLCDAEGKQIGALIVLNDVTRLLRLEKIRREFVANVSHEIKTPITAIKGFVETLRDGAVENHEDAERFLEIIGKHVDRLEAIIEDLLNLSRIEQEAEREKVVLDEGRLKDVLDTAIQVCEASAMAKKIEIELSCAGEIVAELDPTLLEQAVVNLIDNAIKYSSEESAIWIDALQRENETLISVRDQGCGIEKKHLPRLFERFYRVDKARSRQLGGTGLGLAIVKHIAQAHGGHVTVESIPGKGSTFSIHLPRA
ncbi:MAG: cell wall metabolism sensor histidine kinase WalK [Deltaproteobacteria bacterium]|nr:cell wall metabolism sensor histidine kinase WalK [Deltaproteobacteria bacterium]MDL1961238.1 cell wall metabolism sensor histidine kinase WalK [Deltaproteobacteria bacterium]